MGDMEQNNLIFALSSPSSVLTKFAHLTLFFFFFFWGGTHKRVQ